MQDGRDGESSSFLEPSFKLTTTVLVDCPEVNRVIGSSEPSVQ